jgi:hypothetical protein
MAKKEQPHRPEPMLVSGHDPSEADIARMLLAMDLAGDEYVPALDPEDRRKLQGVALEDACFRITSNGGKTKVSINKLVSFSHFLLEERGHLV